MPELDGAYAELGDDALYRCYLIDDQSHADRCKHYNLASSFYELIHRASFTEHPITDNKTILAMEGEGGGSTANATNDQLLKAKDREDDVDFRESAAGLDIAAGATIAASTDQSTVLEDFNDCLEGSASKFEFNSDTTATAVEDFLELADRLLDLSDHEDEGENEGMDASIQHTREYTLQQWIKKHIEIDSNSRKAHSVTPKELSKKYIQSALQIALKLTEFILEAEKDEQLGHLNPIPLSSISSENV
jgi:hypothetical protein